MLFRSGAAGPLLGAGVTVRIANSNPLNIECALSDGGFNIDVLAQAQARAWDAYDGFTAHVDQVYGGAALRFIPNLSFNEAWVPGQREMYATNGTQSQGGSLVTIKVSGPGARKRPGRALTLALAITRATLAVAPRGASPGAPPS